MTYVAHRQISSFYLFNRMEKALKLAMLLLRRFYGAPQTNADIVGKQTLKTLNWVF